MSIPFWPRSIRARLLLVMLAGLSLALIASSLIFWQERGRFARQMSIDHYVERVAAAVRLLDEEDEARREDVLRLMRTPLFRAGMLPSFPARRPVSDANPELVREMEVILRARLEGRRVWFQMSLLPHRTPRPMRVRRHGIERPTPMGYVTVVELRDGSAIRFTSRLPGDISRWPLKLLISTLILLLAAVILSFLSVRFVMRPLNQVTEQAEQIGSNLDTPEMKETGPTEVRRMASTMNVMQRKIKQLFEQRSRFLAAVSHDLRTPITRLRLRLELIEDETVKTKMERDLIEMEGMVQETLEFMRDDANRESMRKIDISALLEASVEDFRALGSDIVLNISAKYIIETRPVALRRCIDNLLNNALRYGKQVVVECEQSGKDISIKIIDNGPGIPENELERVFEPFYRLDQSRGGRGSGLGLSIARSIMQSLGGKLSLSNRHSGGLVAEITLTRAVI